MSLPPLFVYGTLRPGQRNWPLLADHVTSTERARLADHGLFGRTWPFPYAAPLPGATVVGDVVHLIPRHYDVALATVDDLEGCRPGHPDNHYDRLLLKVALADGTAVETWVYVAGPSAPALPETQLIPTGDWLRRRSWVDRPRQ